MELTKEQLQTLWEKLSEISTAELLELMDSYRNENKLNNELKRGIVK